MKYFKNIFVLFCFFILNVKAQTENLTCNYEDVSGYYSCQISGAVIADDETLDIAISGEHLPQRSDVDVNRVEIIDSNIPFVVTQIFTKFPNISILLIENAGLTRFQIGAFRNGGNLRSLGVRSNQIENLTADSFEGAWNLQTIYVIDCQVSTVDGAAFNGLSVLDTLLLSNNNIQQLPVNVFSSLPALNSLFIKSNKLESLDGRLFSNNFALRFIDLENNQINAIQRNLFDSLSQLSFFNILRNRCASNYWVVNGGTVTADTIREGLTACFENFVEPPEPELRRFILEVRGPFSLRFENGTKIVQI